MKNAINYGVFLALAFLILRMRNRAKRSGREAA